MLLNKRKILIAPALAASLLFVACNHNAKKGGGEFVPVKTNIVLSGSSITWGGGGKFEAGSIMTRFSGQVLDYVMNELSTTMLPEQMRFNNGDTSSFHNKMLYEGKGIKISGLHSKVEFDLYGDEIALCQVALRTSDFGVMQVKADGEIIGRFSNVNRTIGEEEEVFSGDGETVKFELKHPATYAHEVSVNKKEQTGEIHDGAWSRNVPENPGFLVVRKLNESNKPVHFVWFKSPPEKGSSIKIKYRYGKIICFEGSSLGQLSSDEKNECVYGEGKVSYDITQPAVLSSGMEYRYVDKNAFWIHKFTEAKKRHYEIKIIDGVNPYFIINFASNRFHNFMNAGIGGWKLSLFLDNDGVHDYTGFFDKFIPDIIINESATNDDADFSSRQLHRIVTGLSEEDVKKLWTFDIEQIKYNKNTKDYTVRFTTGKISYADKYQLKCPQIKDADVNPGDIIRIGTYHGDNHQVVCREISSVNNKEGVVRWEKPLLPEQILNINSYEDLSGAECTIRDLSGYEALYEKFIRKIQNVSPATRILIAQPGLSNYRMLALWGYEIIHRKLVAKFHNVGVIEVRDWISDYQSNNISGKSYVDIEATGQDEYELPWTGHWQGFQVWVNGENVYGKDCYIECGAGYSLDPDKHGEELQLPHSYIRTFIAKRPMKLVFTCNKPKHSVIRVEKADNVWAPDFCHTTDKGGYVYGQSYISKIGEYLY